MYSIKNSLHLPSPNSTIPQPLKHNLLSPKTGLNHLTINKHPKPIISHPHSQNGPRLNPYYKPRNRPPNPHPYNNLHQRPYRERRSPPPSPHSAQIPPLHLPHLPPSCHSYKPLNHQHPELLQKIPASTERTASSGILFLRDWSCE